jgi:hypothetical protein
MCVHACILNLRLILNAYERNPEKQAGNLDRGVLMINNYVKTVTPGLITEDRKRAVSDALSSVNIDEKEAEAISSK